MGARRNGFGCITPPKGRPGPFTIRWHEGDKHRRKSGFPTRKAAADELARIRVTLSGGGSTERPEVVTVGRVVNEWLRLHSAVLLRSHDGNERAMKLHVLPFFGEHAPLTAVTAPRILEFRAALQAEEYAPGTINLILALVRAVLKFAVVSGYLNASPTDKLGKGMLSLPLQQAKLDPPIKSPEDVGRLLDAIHQIRPHQFALFATLVYCGLRKGEACALRWADIDLEKRMVSVRRSFHGPTKSGKERAVPIPSELVTILKAHKLAEPFRGELAFPNDAGEMYTSDSKLQRSLRAALKAIGLPPIRVHDLRHTHAAMFLMAGGSIFDLQKNLGHHSIDLTASIYGHLSPDHRVKEADRVSFPAPTDGKVLQFPRRKRQATS